MSALCNYPRTYKEIIEYELPVKAIYNKECLSFFSDKLSPDTSSEKMAGVINYN